jgi:hypothetical protein
MQSQDVPFFLVMSLSMFLTIQHLQWYKFISEILTHPLTTHNILHCFHQCYEKPRIDIKKVNNENKTVTKCSLMDKSQNIQPS